MKNLNESLLESIDLIQESTIESELNVLFAMGEEYAKAAMITEYADASVINEFDIIQESAIFMEADEAKKEDDKKETAAKKDNPIVRFAKWLAGIIVTFYNWLKKKFAKTEKKINTKIKGKEKKALEKILNSTMAGVMGEVNNAVDTDVTSREYIDHIDTSGKDLKSAKEIYALSKKKTFKVETPDNQISILVNIPTFYEGFKSVITAAVKKAKDTTSFDFKKIVSFEYVSYAEANAKFDEEANKIKTFITTELPKLAAESNLAGKNEKSADALGSHLKSLAEGFQGRMVRASMAFYDIVDVVVNDVMNKDLTAE